MYEMWTTLAIFVLLCRVLSLYWSAPLAERQTQFYSVMFLVVVCWLQSELSTSPKIFNITGYWLSYKFYGRDIFKYGRYKIYSLKFSTWGEHNGKMYLYLHLLDMK